MVNRLFLSFIALTFSVVATLADASRHVVLIVWDGMRPDFVTEKYAPTLDKLARDGVRFRNHHSVYPTATDVNGAALATGSYPNRNGLCANLEFRPDIDSHQPIDTSDPEAIKRGDETSHGKYLSVPTFPELLRQAGKSVALVGTKSVALLFDRHNDWIVVQMQNRPITIFAGAPMSVKQRDELTKLIGPFFDETKATAAQRNDFATRALTEFFWRDGVPDFSLLWLSEPDLAQHNFAPGSPQALAAIKAVDDDLATVLGALDKNHVRDSTDVLVVSDHGFSTIGRSIDLIALLNSAGFHAATQLFESPKPGDIVVAGNGGTVLFYVQNHDRETTQRLVDWLQRSDFAGVILTGGRLDGTFPLSAARMDTSNAADVVMSFRWNKSENEFQVCGKIDADWNRKAGEGSHATLSPFDLHNTLIASGRDFIKNKESDIPTGNVDIAPTILRLLRVKSPDVIEGRTLSEAMVDGEKVPWRLRTRTAETNRILERRLYEAYLETLTVGEYSYLKEGNGSFPDAPRMTMPAK